MLTAGIMNSEIILFNDAGNRTVIKRPITDLGRKMLNNELSFINHAPLLNKICININCADTLTLIMKYRGESLQDKIIKRTLNMPLSVALKGLATATYQLCGFIHGDIKPENILVYENQFFFIDYGCSRLTPGKAIAFTDEYSDNNLIKYGLLEYSSDKYAFAKVLRKVFLYYLTNGKDFDIEIEAVSDCIETIFEKVDVMSWSEIRNNISTVCEFDSRYQNLNDAINRISYEKTNIKKLITMGRIIHMRYATGTYSES